MMTSTLIIALALLIILPIGAFFLNGGVLLFTLRRFRLTRVGYRTALWIALATFLADLLLAAALGAGGIAEPWPSIVSAIGAFLVFFWLLLRREKTSFTRALGAYVVGGLLCGVATALVIIPAVVAIRWFLASPFEVNGESMSPTLRPADLVMVDKTAVRHRELRRGEIVIIVPPGQERQHYVSRVVGLPDERIAFVGNRVVRYDTTSGEGLTLPEPYIDGHAVTGSVTAEPIDVPDGYYVVLGDNRDHSTDSRVFGPVPVERIVGVVGWRFWPPAAAGAMQPSEPPAA